MSAQVRQSDRLIQVANDVVSQVDDAYQEVEGNHKFPALKDAANTFTAALIEYRDAVLKGIVAASIAAAGDSSSRIAKATEWRNKKPWQKGPGSTGTWPRMSTLTEDAGGAEQKFEDKEIEPVIFAETEKKSVPEAPKKKKVVKSVSIVSRNSQKWVGSQLTEFTSSVLRPVSYLVSQTGTLGHSRV